jgi:hypothetical protein
LIDLVEPVKKVLRFSPSLYKTAYTFYRATPLGKRRMAEIERRMAEIDEQTARLLQLRIEQELLFINKYMNDDWTVRYGPFAGMKYAPITSGSLLSPKVIGSYESSIHQWITDAINHNYQTIINVGSGEGYYAVGFSLKSQNSNVFAYDRDKDARENVATLANLNGTADRVHIRALCTKDELKREITKGTLIFCDIDGGEFDLFRPDVIPELLQADLIIETHDYGSPGVTEALVQRFLPSHRVDISYHCAKYASDFPVLEAIPNRERAFLVEEARPLNQNWMRLLANRPGAIKPDPNHWWSCGGEQNGSM